MGHVTREDGDGSHGDEGDGVEVEDELVLSHVVRFHDLFAVCGEDCVAAQGGDLRGLVAVAGAWQGG